MNSMTETNTFRIETNGTKFRVARLHMPGSPGAISPCVPPNQGVSFWPFSLASTRPLPSPPPPPEPEWRLVGSSPSSVFSAMLVASFLGTEKKFDTWDSFKTEKQARAFIRRMYGETAKIEEPTWRPL